MTASSRHLKRTARRPAFKRSARVFKGFEHCVKLGVVASILHPFAGISRGGAVAAKSVANFSERQPEYDVREVHGALPGKSDPRAAARSRPDLRKRDCEGGSHRDRDEIAKLFDRSGPSLWRSVGRGLRFKNRKRHGDLI
jgi:hypothetical protein